MRGLAGGVRRAAFVARARKREREREKAKERERAKERRQLSIRSRKRSRCVRPALKARADLFCCAASERANERPAVSSKLISAR